LQKKGDCIVFNISKIQYELERSGNQRSSSNSQQGMLAKVKTGGCVQYF